MTINHTTNGLNNRPEVPSKLNGAVGPTGLMGYGAVLTHMLSTYRDQSAVSRSALRLAA